jgi:hypothetical protein
VRNEEYDPEQPVEAFDSLDEEALFSMALSQGVPEEIVDLATEMERDERRSYLIRLIADEDGR